MDFIMTMVLQSSLLVMPTQISSGLLLCGGFQRTHAPQTTRIWMLLLSICDWHMASV